MSESKRTMTLNLTDEEMMLLIAIAHRRDISKTALLRQALRLYSIIDARTKNGEKLVFEDAGSNRAEMILV